MLTDLHHANAYSFIDPNSCCLDCRADQLVLLSSGSSGRNVSSLCTLQSPSLVNEPVFSNDDDHNEVALGSSSLPAHESTNDFSAAPVLGAPHCVSSIYLEAIFFWITRRSASSPLGTISLLLRRLTRVLILFPIGLVGRLFLPILRLLNRRRQSHHCLIANGPPDSNVHLADVLTASLTAGTRTPATASLVRRASSPGLRPSRENLNRQQVSDAEQTNISWRGHRRMASG
ncbi:unnamed protein product [Protopolystoma xenopodis]|uniref:Uncharacterized protein n=1 Tax=Protopolystoma xenopodis TaxID=117903 RepID=A0A3S5BCT5_9PLAT|nr:unnamed protein product [Protopolystoma xenopodis]